MGLLDKFGFGKKKDSGDGPASLKSNRRIDIEARFEKLRTAVSGTMSKFYAARDREKDQIVGLKLCDLAKFSFFESRFKGMNKPPEGEIAAMMDHPNIIKTLEYGKTTAKEPYLIMEFIDGPGLNTLIQNQDAERLAGRRLDLIKQMADALHYVHQKGYIHRDICPRNFICDTEIQRIKLIDFGLTVPATEAFMRPGNRTGTTLHGSRDRSSSGYRPAPGYFRFRRFLLSATDLRFPLARRRDKWTCSAESRHIQSSRHLQVPPRPQHNAWRHDPAVRTTQS